MTAPDKGALLVAFLESKGIHIRDTFGNQKVSCFMHDDRNPSASVNLELGLYHCFSCDTSGDVYALIRIDRGVNFVEAVRISETELGASSQPVPRPSVSRRFLPGVSGPTRSGSRRFLPPRLRG